MTIDKCQIRQLFFRGIIWSKNNPPLVAKNVDFSTSSSFSPTCTFLSKSLGPAGKRIWPQFSTRLFPCRTTFLSTLGTVVARNCSPRWPLPTPAMSLAVKKGFFNLYYLQQQQQRQAACLLLAGAWPWPIHFYVNMTRLALEQVGARDV